MGFIRLFVIFFVLYLLVRFVSRLLFPFLFVNKQDSHFKQKTSKRDGEVTIDYVEKKKRKKGDDNEEYVDYEEVK